MKYILLTIFITVFLCGIPVIVQSQNTDINLLREINSNPSPFLRNFSVGISNSTTVVSISVPIVLGTTAFITKDESLLEDAFAVGISLGVSASLTYGLKHIINRPRPVVTWPDQIIPYENIYSNSMPSGHTSFAFATATSLSLRYPKWYVIAPALIWAGSVGYSRMNLGVHYPSDVLAGAVLGVGSAYFSSVISNWLYPKVNPVKKLRLDGYFL